jgi:hypothetical protein
MSSVELDPLIKFVCPKIKKENIVTCIGDYMWVSDWMIGFIASYIFTTRDYRQLQRYRQFTHFTVHRYTRIRILSSLVVSRQRIYNSLTVTSDHTYSLLFTA